MADDKFPPAEEATPAPQSLEGMLQRKQDHIDLVLEQRQYAAQWSDFDAIRLPHNALPDVNFAEIDLSTRFLGHSLHLPFLISSMTGGPARAEAINTHLAEAARELGLAMGVGSQRVALTGKGDGAAGLEARIRQLMGNQPLFANLGAVQLVEEAGTHMALRAIESLEADALILHLNPMQEMMQDGGDIQWQGVSQAMAAFIAKSPVPVIVKEVGFGISAKTALQLQEMGVAAIDVAGRGGTNFGLVEGARSHQAAGGDTAQLFAHWGLTTVESLTAIKADPSISLPLVASGGIRHGLDAARAVFMGATLVGQAGPVLKAAINSTQSVIDHYTLMAHHLRIALFGAGAKDLACFQALNSQVSER